MELGWGALALLCIAAAAAWFWQDSLAAREAANGAAQEACERLSLQFLDGTVAFARVAFVRVAGRLTLRRTYVFDYTANSIERRHGFVVLVGRRIESVGYERDEAGARMQSATPVQPAPPSGEGAKILRLDEWRSRSAQDSDGPRSTDSGDSPNHRRNDH